MLHSSAHLRTSGGKTADRRKKNVRRDSLPLGALKGCGIGFLSLLLLLAVFASIAAGAENPGILYAPFSLCALYLGAMTAGIAAVRFSSQSLLSGLMAGTFYAVGIFLLGLAPLPESGFPSSVYWIFLLTVIPAAVLGSVIGQKKKARPAYRR